MNKIQSGIYGKCDEVTPQLSCKVIHDQKASGGGEIMIINSLPGEVLCSKLEKL